MKINLKKRISLFLLLIGIFISANMFSQKGLIIGTVSDLDDNFQINVPLDGLLIVSYIGFKTKEVPVNGKKDLSIALDENNEILHEIVVIGYGWSNVKSYYQSLLEK